MSEALKTLSSSPEKELRLNLSTVWGKLDSPRRETLFGFLIRSVGRVLHDAYSQPMSTVACLLILTVALVLWGGVFVLFSPIHQLLESKMLQVPIRVELANNVEESEVSSIMEGIYKIQSVGKVSVLQPEEMLRDLQLRIGKDHPLLVGITEETNPFSPRLLVNLDSDAVRSEVTNKIHALKELQPSVQSIYERSRSLEHLQTLVGFMSSFTLLLNTFTFIGALLLVSVALHLRLLLRAEELQILSFVGASRRYILAPLYTEAVFLSLIASVIAIFLLTTLDTSYRGILSESLPAISASAFPSFFLLPHQVLLSFMSVLLGLLGCFITSRYCLKES